VAGAVLAVVVFSAQAFAPPPAPTDPDKSRSGATTDPDTPLDEVLPVPPKVAPPAGPLLTDDLRQVPEVEFQARPEKVSAETSGKQAPHTVPPPHAAGERDRVTHQIAKINSLNAKKPDAFMALLLERRDDLRGLPFVMGEDCRTPAARAKEFLLAAQLIQEIRLLRARTRAGTASGEPSAVFWEQFEKACAEKDKEQVHRGVPLSGDTIVARVAAVVQIFAAEPPEWRVGLVKYLSGVQHPEATRALARLAVFSAEDDVRLAALEALGPRPPEEYTDVLIAALRYPWPAVAGRAADAVAALSRTDLVPALVAVLDESDPRMPFTAEAGGKKLTVVRELVRLNHHRNCLMCHAPADQEKPSRDVLTADVPLPGRSLPSLAGYSRRSTPGLAVRVDVTYLRQDFSVMMPVADAHPWPYMQRFDFLVRERPVTAEEAATFREKLALKEGTVSPYHEAAVAALRILTGKDAPPTAAAWRKVLEK
jgi:hypothetical protein